jgi:hemin uptake protein HemP
MGTSNYNIYRTMSKIRIGCSPITGTIYAGSVSKTGLWGNNKVDVTDEAVKAVAQSLLQTEEMLRFSHDGKQYELKVVPINEGGNK